MKIQSLLLIVLTLLLLHCQSGNQPKEDVQEADVQIAGAMMNVMRKGELQGVFDLSAIANQSSTYGLGPVEYLNGELLVFDGKAYQSRVAADSSMEMRNDFQVKAPFFVYAKVQEWEEQKMPNEIENLTQLEAYLDKITKDRKHPFAFKFSGTVERASIHVVNLPKGASVRSHQDAHQGIVNYSLSNELVDVLGFFSTSHQGIFTHHDSYVHMHLLTADKTKMGHLDELHFNPKNIKLFLPKN